MMMVEEEKKQRMLQRVNRKKYLLYPEDTQKQRWDIIMTYCLIFTCSSTPLFISFHDETESMDTWEYINLIVDIFFGLDIIIIFFSAFYDENFQIVDNFKDIARNYIFGWFLLDLMAITPFDEFSQNQSEDQSSNVNELVRIAKLGRM